MNLLFRELNLLVQEKIADMKEFQFFLTLVKLNITEQV